MDEAERIAIEAGLARLPSDAPGHRRVRCGRGFSYRSVDGDLITGDARAEIEALAIPPAWSDVWISPEPDSHILATGVDQAGRKQYLYHPRWRAAADAAKFRRLAEFDTGLVALRRRVLSDLRGPLDRQDTQAALVTRILDHTLIRIGSRRYADENDTYGATTLLVDHVDIDGSTVRLAFPAKGGHEHEAVAEDGLLARRLGALVERLDGGDPIFHDDDGRPISRQTVNDYIEGHSGGRFTAKDFRTWGASAEVTGALAVEPWDVGDPERVVREAIECAADRLGNTPAVCRASYVAPAVVEAYPDGRLATVWERSRRSAWLTRAERTCGRVLAADAATVADAA